MALQQDHSYSLNPRHRDLHQESLEYFPQNRTLDEATRSWEKVSHLELVDLGWGMSWAPEHCQLEQEVPGSPGDLEGPEKACSSQYCSQ